MKKRTIMGLLILALACLLLPAAALAVTVEIAGTPLTSGAYYVNNSAKNGIEASATTDYNVRYVEVGNEATLYLKGLEVNRPDNLDNLHACIFASGFTTNIPKLTIVLEGGSNTLVAKDAQSSETTDIAAIYVSNGSLVVKGTGTLTATGGIANSVASYGVYVPNGSLTIEGGTLEAYGGSAANLKTSYGVYARYGIEVSDGSITGTGGNVAQISYGVYTDTITVNGTLDGTGGAVGNANDPGSSYGVYSGGNVTVTGALTGTGGKVTLGTGNPSAASSIGVQCGGEVNVRNGSLTGTGGAAVAKTNDAISIGVATDSGINVTGNNGSVIGNGGACSKTAGTGGAFSYGVVYDGNFVVGSSSMAEASFLNGTGGVANDNSDSNNSRSIGVYGIGSSEFSHAIEEATVHGHGEMHTDRAGRRYQFDFSRIGPVDAAVGTVILAFDVTEQAFAERNRREFTANVSHELKTPLQSIIGSAELIENHMVKPEDMPRFVGHIKREAARLLALIEDIIRLSQLDEGCELPMENVDLTALCEEVSVSLNDAAEARSIRLSVGGEHVVVRGVRRLLYEVVFNLCDNAIKYNVAGGSVEIAVSGDEKNATVAVRDTGIGIPPEHQSRVFERFYRVDKSHSKASGGTGLGLSITKHAVAYHHGKIELQSVPGKGTSVIVTLPKA